MRLPNIAPLLKSHVVEFAQLRQKAVHHSPLVSGGLQPHCVGSDHLRLASQWERWARRSRTPNFFRQ